MLRVECLKQIILSQNIKEQKKKKCLNDYTEIYKLYPVPTKKNSSEMNIMINK